MITVDDLRDESRPSGFSHVHPVTDNGREQFRAYLSGGGPTSRLGPRRDSAREAAQDRANHLNGVEVSPRRAQYTPGVYDVTDPDTGRKIEATEDEETKRPSSADGPTAAYVVAFVNRSTHPRRPGTVVSVKVGTTFKKNRSKYALTMGLDVREIITPIPTPSRKAAESVALRLEVALDASPRFERQGAECFAPVLDASFKFTSLLATKAMRDVLADVRDEHASVA